MSTKTELLNEAGRVIAPALLAANALSFVVIGIQLFMCTYCLTLFFESPKEARRVRLPYIIIMILLFVIPTIAACSDLGLMFRTTFYAGSPAEFMKRRGTENDWFGFACAVLMLTVVNGLGDGLMIYRCYIIWSDKFWVLALPISCWVTALVFAILSLLPLKDNIALGITDVTYVALWALTSVATNISVTSLIAFRLIKARHHITALNPGSKVSVVAGAVAILIESALPLSVLGIAYAINLALQKPSNGIEAGKQAANCILSSLYFAFTSLSPQMIIFRITTGKSWVGRQETSEQGITKSLAFARSNARDALSSIGSSEDMESSLPTVTEKNGRQGTDEP